MERIERLNLDLEVLNNFIHLPEIAEDPSQRPVLFCLLIIQGILQAVKISDPGTHRRVIDLLEKLGLLDKKGSFSRLDDLDKAWDFYSCSKESLRPRRKKPKRDVDPYYMVLNYVLIRSTVEKFYEDLKKLKRRRFNDPAYLLKRIKKEIVPKIAAIKTRPKFDEDLVRQWYRFPSADLSWCIAAHVYSMEPEAFKRQLLRVKKRLPCANVIYNLTGFFRAAQGKKTWKKFYESYGNGKNVSSLI